MRIRKKKPEETERRRSTQAFKPSPQIFCPPLLHDTRMMLRTTHRRVLVFISGARFAVKSRNVGNVGNFGIHVGTSH